MLTAPALLAICPKLGASAGIWTAALSPAMAWANIDTAARMASFIAQAAHESAEFTRLVENLNYSADGLLKTFPSHFDSVEAVSYARNPERIANRVYASRMGNGDESSGDGWRFRGRGPFQLTGKANYFAFSQARYKSAVLLENPDALIDSKDGAMSAAWFWLSHGLNILADAGAFLQITKKINGGTNGLDSRLAYHRIALDVLGGSNG